jgi:predicted unusual protein kinase regulating ubiquinone biosynthesis (AarF/ABC1/UbiB family)
MVRFFRVSRLLLWTLWVIYRERRRVIRARERGNYEVQPDVEVLINVLVAFRHTAVKLGVLMIKLGQFLSSRADLLPERALEVLSALQDEVPPESFDHVISVIESELGKPVEQVFSVVERKAAAAASLGQVHKAVLVATGEEVAVKVQRPHIEQLVRSDLSTIKFVIWIINRLVDTREFIDLMGVYREFKRTIYEEIDYVTEAANARRFKEMFKDDPAIYIPRVYEEYTTRRVLVLEWINGIKINDYAALDAAGIDKLEVAKRTVRAYFHQFFEAGFFHADPHPGNIFIKKGPPEVGPIIEFVDFGMVGSLTRSMKKALRDLFVSFVLRDSRALVDALRRLGFIGEGANLVAIERGLSMMLDQYYGMTLGEARQLDIPEVGEDVGRLLYGQPFHIPAQFAFTGRAVSTLVGVATGLAPEFNFVDVATPYARRFLNINAQGARQTVEQLVRQLTEAGTILMRLPREVEQLVSKIDAGQIEVKADLGLPHARGRGRRSRGVGEGIGGMASTVAFAVSLGGGILLTNAHQVMAGWFFMGMAALMGLRLLIRR